MTRYSKNLGRPCPPWLRLCTCGLYNICNAITLCKHLRIYITLRPYFYIQTCLLGILFMVK